MQEVEEDVKAKKIELINFIMERRLWMGGMLTLWMQKVKEASQNICGDHDKLQELHNMVDLIAEYQMKNVTGQQEEDLRGIRIGLESERKVLSEVKRLYECSSKRMEI